MLILKIVLFYTIFIFICYRMGLIINKWTKHNNILYVILYGFVSIVAILQILYIPCILLHVNFQVIFYMTLVVFLGIIVLSCIIFPYKKEIKIWKQNYIKLKMMKKKNIIIMAILCIVVIIQAFTASILYNENADDAFYVSLVQQNIDSSNIYNNDPSLGSEETTFLSRYMVSGHELALSILSKAFQIPATILCHTVIPFIMIILSYMAYYFCMRKFLNNEKALTAIIILSVIFLFSGFSSFLRGTILLSRMWQGKEIFLNIILTLIISILYSINPNCKRKEYLELTILNIAAVFFTNTAIFLVPFTYFGIAIILAIKKEWKIIGKLVLTGFPILIYGGLYLMLAQNVHGSTYTQINVWDNLKNYMGTGYYIFVYLIALFIIFWKGNDRAKRYFLVVPCIYALTIYNPIFTQWITKYFTGSEVFWRLFWLLPMEISISYAFTVLLYLKKDKKYKVIIFLIEIVLLIIAGNFVFTKEKGFEKAENLNKIPQAVINQTQFILDKEKQSKRIPTVMAPPEPLHSAMMRQLTSDIHLFWSRYHYMYEIYPPNEMEERTKIYNIYQDIIPSISIEEFNSIREKYNVNWIIIDNTKSDIIQYLDETGAEMKYDIDGYILYQY